MSRGRALEGGRALDREAQGGAAQLLGGHELSDDALEHVVAGLERIYIFDPEGEHATTPAESTRA